MHRPDSIEEILSRLVPPALSNSCQAGIEAMIGQLADPSPTPHSRNRPTRWHWLGGIAAAMFITLGLLISIHSQAPANNTPAASTTPGTNLPPLTLIEECGRVDDASSIGTVEESDGTFLQAWRYHVVEKDRVKDRKTGLVVEVSQPRDEFLLMPVSTF